MELIPGILETVNEMQASLSGYRRRHFMTNVVETMFSGSPTKAGKALGSQRNESAKFRKEIAVRCDS